MTKSRTYIATVNCCVECPFSIPLFKEDYGTDWYCKRMLNRAPFGGGLTELLVSNISKEIDSRCPLPEIEET